MIPNYQQAIKKVLEGNDKLIFLDTNALRPAIIDPRIPVIEEYQNPNSLSVPKDVFDYINVQISNRKYDCSLNKMLISNSKEYLDFLFAQIESNPNVYITGPTVSEVGRYVDSNNIGFIFHEPDYFIKNINARKKILNLLEGKICNLSPAKVVDYNLCQQSINWKDKHPTKANIEDVEIFLNAYKHAALQEKDLEILTHDNHYKQIARIVAESGRIFPKISIRKPFVGLQHPLMIDRSPSLTIAYTSPAA